MDTAPTTGLDSSFAQELGRQLRALRERRRESVDDVGRRLLMSANQIRALEDGEGEPFYGPRYHLQAARKYAAMSGLDFDALQAEFTPRGAPMHGEDDDLSSDQTFLAGEPRGGAEPRTSAARGRPGAAGSKLAIGAAAAVAVAVIAVVAAVLLPDKKAAKVTSEVALPAPANASGPSTSTETSPAAGAATSAQPMPSGAAPASATSAASAPALTPPASPAAGASVPVAPATPPKLADTPSRPADSGAKVAESPRPSTLSPKPAEATPKAGGSASKAASAAAGDMQVTFTGDAWMQVVKRDGSRQTKRYRAKQSVTLHRKDLQAVVISDWKKATMLSDGRKVDLSRHRPRDSNQARLVGAKLRALGE